MIEMLIFCGALATLLLATGRALQRQIKRFRVYGRRTPETLPTIWQRHFAALGVDERRWMGSWLELANTFRVEPGKLQITDRFDRELRNLDHLLDGWMLLTIAAAEAHDEQMRPDRIETVRDFVLLSATTAHDDVAPTPSA